MSEHDTEPTGDDLAPLEHVPTEKTEEVTDHQAGDEER